MQNIRYATGQLHVLCAKDIWHDIVGMDWLAKTNLAISKI